MARVHYWSFAQDKSGAPISGMSISIYLAGTMVPASVYASEIAGDPISTTPQCKTNAMGYFEFWIADESDVHGLGYPSSQKFKLVGDRTGVASWMIDYIDIFPVLMPVDPESDDPAKNKAISNSMAKKWNSLLKMAGNEDFLATLSPGDLNIPSSERNKAVSNDLMRLWQDHRKFNFNSNIILDDKYTDEDLMPWENKDKYPDLYGAHGLLPAEVTGLHRSDTVFNRLVSNALANKWEEHVDYSFKEHNIAAEDFNEPTPHGLERANFSIPSFNLEDPNAPADLVQEYDRYNKLVSNRLIREMMYDSEIKASVTVRKIDKKDWLPSKFEENIFYYTFAHNLHTKFVGVEMSRKVERIDPVTGKIDIVDAIFSPEDIFLISEDIIEIHASNAADCYATVWARRDLLKAMNEDSGTGGGTEPIPDTWKLMFRCNISTAKVKAIGLFLQGADSNGFAPYNGDFYLPTGSYTIEFSEVPGYVTPEPIQVQLNYNRLVEVEYKLKEFKVSFDSNIADGKVKVQGITDWVPISDGVSLINGTYTLDFSEIPGYVTPQSRLITVDSKDQVIQNVEWIPATEWHTLTFETNVTNSSVYVTNEQGFEQMVNFYNGFKLELKADTYTLVFDSVPGMDKPEDMKIIVDKNMNINANYKVN